jgi:hypothetical protein
MIDEAIDELRGLVSTRDAISALGESRATWMPAERVAKPQPRALSEVERKEFRATLESEELIDEAPTTVYAKLLDRVGADEGHYPPNRTGTTT